MMSVLRTLSKILPRHRFRIILSSGSVPWLPEDCLDAVINPPDATANTDIYAVLEFCRRACFRKSAIAQVLRSIASVPEIRLIGVSQEYR